MSLIQHVTQLVTERGRATVDDILPLCPGYTRLQVRKALQNAGTLGHLHLLAWGTRKENKGLGSKPGVWGPVPKGDGRPGSDIPAEPARGDYGLGRVASVWDLARASNDRGAAA